jgi:hypothetical protein
MWGVCGEGRAAGGARGIGGWGGVLGGGVFQEYYEYTHGGTRITVGKNVKL